MALHLQICERAIAVDVARGRAELVAARADLAEAISRLRQHVFDLRPLVLDEIGVAATLRRYAALLPARDGRTVDVEDELGGRRLGATLELALFRLGQVAVENADRHGQASKIVVRLGAEAESARLVAQDDGAGFDADAALASASAPAPGRGGRGLALALDWTRALGGSLDVTSTPGQGSRLEARFPLPTAP